MAVNKNSVYGVRPFENDLGDRIRELRENRGESQADMAAALNLSQRVTIEQWEKGTRFIKAGQLAEIAKHFNVSADYLLGLSPVETNDADLASVCDYTGLSEKAIANIKRIGCFDGERNVADAFLSSDGVITLLKRVALYLKTCDDYARQYGEYSSILNSDTISDGISFRKSFSVEGIKVNPGEIELSKVDYANNFLEFFDIMKRDIRCTLYDIGDSARDVAREIYNDNKAYKSLRDTYCLVQEYLGDLSERQDESNGNNKT